MKTRKRVLYVLMFLPLVATLIALPFLPEQIPAHYGFDGQVTRYGSKYESLIIPAITLAFGAAMLFEAKIAAKKEKDGENNEKVSITTAIAAVVLFNVLTGFFLYTAFAQTEDIYNISLDVYQIVFMVFGAGMIVIGNVMPKLRMNGLIGLRTGWSMKNETTWKKSQRFGGIVAIVTGVVTIIICCFTKGLLCAGLAIGIQIVALPVEIYYTYRAAKKYGDA